MTTEVKLLTVENNFMKCHKLCVDMKTAVLQFVVEQLFIEISCVGIFRGLEVSISIATASTKTRRNISITIYVGIGAINVGFIRAHLGTFCRVQTELR
jgi:hypothetical protein